MHVPWTYHYIGGNPFDDTDSRRYDYGYAFPSLEDPALLIPTLHWEAFREGYDDMRYLKTLEQLIERRRAQGRDVRSAQAWLSELRAMMPRVPDDIRHIDKESPHDTYSSGLAEGQIDLALGVWHDVEVTVEGAGLRISIDGVLQLEYHDPDPLTRHRRIGNT